MPLYELGVIVDPEVNSEEETEAMGRLESIISDGEGEIVERDEWGRRQLAYPIEEKNHGIYHFWKFNAPGTVIDPLNFELRTNDRFMRSLVLNMDNELKRQRKRVKVEQMKAQKKAQKRAAAGEEGAADTEGGEE